MRARPHRVLLYKTGVTDPVIATKTGDYEDWFSRVLGSDVELEIHLAFEQPHHPLRGYDGMIITGSPASLAAPQPWMDDAAVLCQRAHEAGTPILGVCFGHQLLAYAFGGRVHAHPRGWEVGTCEVRVRSEGESDPLFSSLPTRIRANMSHRDEVFDLPPTIRCLAENDHSSAQAIAVGDGTRGVQFHPEISGETLRHILAFRRQRLIEECGHCARAIDVDALIGASSDTPEAEEVLRNFIRHFVDRA